MRLQTELSAGAMADVAFLLLMFFMVATVIDEDKGIQVVLPEWEDKTEIALSNKEVISILLNPDSKTMLDGEEIAVEDIGEVLLRRLRTYEPNEKLPTLLYTSSAGATYGQYFRVYEELNSTYADLWDEKGKIEFGLAWNNLSDQQKGAIQRKYKLNLVENDK